MQQITVESVFISTFTMNNISPKLQNLTVTQNYIQHHIKNAKATKFFHSQPSILPNEHCAKYIGNPLKFRSR